MLGNNKLYRDRLKRIGIIFPFDFLESVPILKNMIIMLAREQYRVDVFTYKPSEGNPEVEFKELNIQIHTLRKRENSFKYIYIPNILRYMFWVAFKGLQEKYDCLIGVDLLGLCVAGLFGILKRTPWVYLSLEIIISWDPYSPFLKFKKLEKWFSRRAAFTIVQDIYRAMLIADDNNIPLNKLVFLVNSPLGKPKYKRSRYWHNKFNIDQNKKILLYSGSLTDCMMVDELLQIPKSLSDNWVLILHTRSKINIDKLCLNKDITVHRSMYISNEPVPYSMLEELVSSSDIGIALYKMNSPNIVFTAKSSGKICQYLYCGVPVIATKMPYWDNSLFKYNSGITVQSIAEICAAVNEIDRSYQKFVQGAINHFDNELSFEKDFDSFLERLNKSI